MSIELPEAYILAVQMSRELRGKEIANFSLQNHEKLQRLGFVNKDSSAFAKLVGGRIESTITRGNVIRVKLNNGLNLILAPEYGGSVLFHTKNSSVPDKFHLKLQFTDDSRLTVTLTGMGIIQALKDEELEQSYVYRRDFSATASPMSEAEFTFERFSSEIVSKNVNVKSVLVGKDAAIVGLGNSAFQDILFRAGIHPKRKAACLTEKEKRALYDATKLVVQERTKAGGKNQFKDLYGRRKLHSSHGTEHERQNLHRMRRQSGDAQSGRWTSVLLPEMPNLTSSLASVNLHRNWHRERAHIRNAKCVQVQQGIN